ncbi:uncharacterized protein LOC117172256 [Belonocnema kinseyi]|uniref:uncharacterized protein LOC117172256 n=1 Tax=Belonocnema kinseyi TaxID=2817044 RepID=UPI00143DF4CF|nr:uncharacterized protein LOC117172256 [Belonocnema kinseyi]
MHLEFRVTLPDHDWVVAAKHKLPPSVVAGICTKPNDEGRPKSETYSGPTFISVRSEKHCSSSAETHGAYFEHLMEISNFDIITKNSQGEVKPVLIMIIDGGPDENPRYPRIIATVIKHFKKYNFDGVFIATNAPGRSAFNIVKRRMAPLSNQLS